jgi:hypothetical protein
MCLYHQISGPFLALQSDSSPDILLCRGFLSPYSDKVVLGGIVVIMLDTEPKVRGLIPDRGQ